MPERTSIGRYTSILVLVLLVAYGAHAFAAIVSQRHLYGDASFFLVRILTEGAVTQFYTSFWSEFYYSRFLAFVLTQFPAVLALRAGISRVELISMIFGATFFFWKVASIGLCYTLLPRDQKLYAIFPVVGLLAGTINSDIYIVTEIHVSTAFYWPLLFGIAWLPPVVSRTRAAAVAGGALACGFLYESMAVLLPLAMLTLALQVRSHGMRPAARVGAMAAALFLASLVNWVAIALPRDPVNRAGLLKGIQQAFVDHLAGPHAFHIGLSISVLFLVLVGATLPIRGRAQRVVALFGAVLLAVLPIAHFLVFRSHLQFANAITDRGTSGFVIQLGVAAVFLIFRYWHEGSMARLVGFPIIALVYGLLAGQIGWQLLATRAWTEALLVVRQSVRTDVGPQSCGSLATRSDGDTFVPLEKVLCNWWVTPLSILVAPQSDVRALVLSTESFRPFDPLNPDALPSMRFVGTRFDTYKRSLERVRSIGPEETIAFGNSGNGWLLVKSGFSFPEDWARWTEGKQAALDLCFSNDFRSADVRLQFRVGAFVPTQRPRLDVEIRANGKDVATWHFAAGDNVVVKSVDIPSAELKSGCVVLQFLIHDPVSPRSMGVSGDGRQLGIALVDMKAIRR